MRDFLPADVRKREYVIGVIKQVYESYGYEPLETPAVENIETLMGKYGEEGNQLVFKILKRGEKLDESLETGDRSRLADLALRDELTGLYNRRGFFALADHQRRQCLRTGRSLVVVQADIDYLKEINDRFGHQAGDQAIGNTAAVLRCTFRESDIVARLGGDEFAAVAVDADDASAARIVERVERALEEQNRRESLPYHLSVSVGVAVLVPPARTTLADLLAEADRLLYQGKRGSRHAWPFAAPSGTVVHPTVAA